MQKETRNRLLAILSSWAKILNYQFGRESYRDIDSTTIYSQSLSRLRHNGLTTPTKHQDFHEQHFTELNRFRNQGSFLNLLDF